MYRIGQFSKMAKVTVKALRFYEEEGLLAPRHVDWATGYRYYGSDQLPRIHRIVALRQCGFSLPEIRQALAGRDLADLFARRQRELERAVQETSRQLASVHHYLESLKEGSAMEHQIVVKELPRVVVFSKRMIVESYDSYFTEIPKIGEEVVAANPDLKCLDDPPYCFIVYHDGEYKERDIDVEYCEAVLHPGRDTETITFKTVEAVPAAACVLHRGPYAGLSRAYAAVYAWIEEHGCRPLDHPREAYIDGIWNKGDPADWLTEVQVPIAFPS